MKRFKAFTLTEILTGTMLQAGFVIVLMGAFYMLVNFQAANTKLIIAREKGQRVLAYIENRIIHAGLGLWKCKSPSEIRDSFGDILKTKAFKSLTLPVAVTNDNTNTGSNWNALNSTRPSDGIYKGNVLTVLYAVPYPGTGDGEKILVIDNKNSGEIKTISGDVECKFLGGSYALKDLKNYARGEKDNLYSYKVTVSSGAPLYIKTFDDGNKFTLTTKFTRESIDITSGSELFTLQCEKMYVTGTMDTKSERVFTRVNLNEYNNWSAAESASANKAYENGILDIYFELDANNNILNCYVLASGGRDFSLNTQRPESWPSSAHWDNNYKYHEVYVSRASWKLHNINWSKASWAKY